MKYMDRKNTPLKWHTFLKIVLPIILAYHVYQQANTIVDLFNQNGVIAKNLYVAGYSLSHMGILFWPICGSLLIEIVQDIFLVYACIGLWKWEIYGCKSLLVAMNIEVVMNIVNAILLIRMPAYFLYMSGGMTIGNGYQMILQNVLLAAFIMTAIFYFVLFGLSYMYYKKRIQLFDSYYVQPQIIQEHTDNQQTIDALPTTQTRFCPTCGTQITEDDAKFCPNCGEKL